MSRKVLRFAFVFSVTPWFVFVLVAICLAAFVSPEDARAHPSRRVKWEEMHVFRDRIVLFLRYDISDPQYTSDLRERFDVDASRGLSAEERKSLVDYAQALALRDMHLRWDDDEALPAVTLKATSGLDRALPSAYPINLYWQIDFVFPESPTLGRANHELAFEDAEARWNSPFACRIRLAPGVEELTADVADEKEREALPRDFEFENGIGAVKLVVWHGKK